MKGAPGITAKYLIMTAVAALFLVILGVETGHAERQNAVYKSVDFRGLEHLGKYEILNGAGVKVSEAGLLVDIGRLQAYLKKEPLVQDFHINSGGDRLVVTVREKKPVFLMAAVKGAQTVLFEVDARFDVLSVHRVHAVGQPLIIISQDEIVSGKLSPRIRKLLEMLSELRDGGSRLYREIAEVDAGAYPKAVLTLHGRKTVVYLDLRHFRKDTLGYIVGYLDRKGRHHERVEYFGDFAVVK